MPEPIECARCGPLPAAALAELAAGRCAISSDGGTTAIFDQPNPDGPAFLAGGSAKSVVLGPGSAGVRILNNAGDIIHACGTYLDPDA